MKSSDWEFKTTTNNTITDLMDKLDSIQELVNNVSREMEILRKKSKRYGRDQIHYNRIELCIL